MRKKWTAQTELTDSLLKLREKRKWQIALRRYILEKNKGFFYAPFFGLDIVHLRKWIEIQFDEDLNWRNFSTAWQFNFIVPVSYFDFNDVSDLKLCWNFTNIHIEKMASSDNNFNKLDLLAAKTYFETLFKRTRYSLCQKMVEKISRIEQSQINNKIALEKFVAANRNYIEALSSFEAYEFNKLNEGISFDEVIAERELLKKFGST